MENRDRAKATEDRGDPIVCPLSRWYFRRMGILALLLAGLALYFLYDGAIGYPEKNFAADLFDAFEAGRSELEWAPPGEAAGRYSADRIAELEKAHQSGKDGETWAAFAAGRRLPERAPKRYSEAEIQEQFRFAILLGAIALAIAGGCLAQRKKAFRCDRETIVTPRGKEIPFADVTRLDLRKWDRGIARLKVTAGGAGAVSSVKVDDYKYAGADRILRRLCESNPDLEIVGDRRWIFGAGEPASGPE